MSLVRLEADCYSLDGDNRKLAAEIWPILAEKPDEKWLTLEPKYIDIDDVPGWVADVNAIKIKPIKKVQFTSPAPKFTNGNIPEVKEFLKTVNQITMPGFELLRYAAIKFESDACTNSIQQDLDDGWRIIAVLPQPQQRRPDYILVRELKP